MRLKNCFSVNKIVLITFLSIFPLFLHSQADFWPHIRGVKYNGHSYDPELNISQHQQFPILWQSKVGQGYSGCVISGNRIFTQSQDRSGQYVVCLDLLSGKENWRTNYGWPWELKGQYPGTYATPTLYKGRIYFSGCYGEIGCLDIKSGKKIWIKNLKKDFKIKLPGFGYACTPLLDDDKIFLTLGEEGGSVMALQASDGEMIWKSGKKPASYSSPIMINIDSRKQLICFLANALVSYDPITGKELWEVKISEGYDEHAAWPVFASPYLFCASPFFRDAHMLKLSYDKNVAVKSEKWKSKAMSNDIFSSVIVDDYLYGFDIEDAQINSDGKTDGRFKCLNLKTGEEMWSTDATTHVNVLVLHDKLILFSDSGVLIIAKATHQKYEEITRQEIIRDGKCWSMPAIVNGRLILRGGKYVVCVDLNKSVISGNKESISIEETYTIMEEMEQWLHQYDDIVYIAPKYRHMLLWYLYSVAIIIFSALFISSAVRVVDGFKNKEFLIFFMTISLFGVIGPIICSPIAEEFIFTLPITLFISLIALFRARKILLKQSRKHYQLYSRILLISFILFCFCFYTVCKSLFIISGIGFLVGLIPLLPIALFVNNKSSEKMNFKEYSKIIILFTIYFWCSAIFIVWKTH